MRILRVICFTNPKNGGPIEGIKQITPVLDRLGHSTEIVCLDPPNSEWLDKMPCRITAVGENSTGYGFSPKLVPWIRKNAPRFDAVVVHGLWQFSSIGAWQALNHANIPYYLYTHGMLDPWFKKQYPLKHLKKTVYWLSSEHKVLRDAKAVLFTSEEEKLLARQSFKPYRCNEKVVAYGTSTPISNLVQAKERFLRDYPALLNRQLVLYLSRIHEKKGCDLLIEAFAQVASLYPNVDLVMAGPDQTGLGKRLEKRSQELKIAHRIHWTGMLNGTLKAGAFAAADVFMLPSHQENFGISVAESLAHGLPVLISNKVNIWREIESDKAGFVANDTLEGSISLLTKWLELSLGEKLVMRRNASKSFESRFHIDAAARSLIDVVTSKV